MWIIVTIVCLSLLTRFYTFYFHKHAYIANLFDLDKEWNFPTYYQTFTLLISSLLFLLIANIKKSQSDRFAKYWFMMGSIFLIMSIDENVQLHEQTSQYFQNFSPALKMMRFAWVLPAFIFLVGFGVAFLKFFLHFNNKYRKLFFLSAFIYVLGAWGIENIGGFFQYFYGQDSAGYILLTNLEETFEMTGIAILIITELKYLKENGKIQFILN